MKQHEFVEVHGEILGEIVGSSNAIIEGAHNALIVEVMPGAEDGEFKSTITQGEVDSVRAAAHFEQRGLHISEDESTEFANIVNSTRIITAETAISGLLATVSTYRDFSDLDDGVDEEVVLQRGFVDFTSATYKELILLPNDERPFMRLRSAELRGAEWAGDAQDVFVEGQDEQLRKTLVASIVGGDMLTVTYKVDAKSDPLIERTMRILNKDDIIKLNKVLGAVPFFVDDEVIDDFLSRIWQGYVGTSKEQEIGPLLDELRDRITANEEASVLRLQHPNSMLPPIDELHEIAEILAKASDND